MKNKKIPKYRFNDFKKKIKAKIIDARDFHELMRLNRHLNNAQKLLNKNHNKNFNLDHYKPTSLANLIKINSLYRSNRNVRAWSIQAHRDFFCPKTKKMLDLDSCFFIGNELFDLSLIDAIKIDYLKTMQLENI